MYSNSNNFVEEEKRTTTQGYPIGRLPLNRISEDDYKKLKRTGM